MKTALMVTVIALFSGTALALEPPIDHADLKKEAALIVKGEVLDVQCAPRGFEQTNCATTDWYVATLHVNTLKKGDWPGRTIPILFRHVQHLHGCTGSADHLHRVGERGFYYLKPAGDGQWALLNWSAVEVKRPGEGPLPLCR